MDGLKLRELEAKATPIHPVMNLPITDADLELYDALRNALPEILRQEWVPVGIALPKDDEGVLVVARDSGAVDLVMGRRVRFLMETREKGEDCYYSHWRPLPAPPLQGAEDAR